MATIELGGISEGAGKNECSEMRKKMEGTLNLYREELKQLRRRNDRKPKYEKKHSLHKLAASNLRNQGKWINTFKRIGEVPGIRAGDEFESRAEMYVVGLHCQFDCGIDYLKEESVLATSIVDSGRYANLSSSDWFLYSGSGGNPLVNGKGEALNQKLERGNLALRNSMKARTPVRVIRKDRLSQKFRYCGLFMVNDFKESRGTGGNIVYKFLLRKIVGDTNVNWRRRSSLLRWTSTGTGGLMLIGDTPDPENGNVIK